MLMSDTGLLVAETAPADPEQLGLPEWQFEQDLDRQAELDRRIREARIHCRSVPRRVSPHGPLRGLGGGSAERPATSITGLDDGASQMLRATRAIEAGHLVLPANTRAGTSQRDRHSTADVIPGGSWSANRST